MLTLASRYSWDSSASTFSVTLPAHRVRADCICDLKVESIGN